MASRSIRAVSLAALILSLCFAASIATQPARAASPLDLPLTQQTIKFYIDPALLSDMDFARAVLPKYVSDMNTVLARNTRRRLVFDPQTGIIPTTARPQTNSATPPLPTEGFEIWAHVTQTTSSISFGGYTGVDKSGAGVLDGLYWTRLYDPDNLAVGNVRDYTMQIDHMLHELGHVFGAASGEYYSLASITDTTGIQPLLNINVMDPGDAYWSDKPDFILDPMLRFTSAASRADYLSQAEYSNLTAAVINGEYRNGILSFTNFTVQVLDKTGQPLPGAEVKVWNVQAASPYASQLLYDLSSDETGQLTLDWGGLGSMHSANNLLRLIKVYKDGAPLTQPIYISVFDLDVAQLVNGQSSFTAAVTEADHAPTDVLLSGSSINENQPAGTTVGTLSGVDPDSGDTLTYSLCGGPGDASFNLVDATLRSAVSFDYESQSTYSVCVQADDGFGGTLQRSFDIHVNDLLDANRTGTFTSAGAYDGWVRESAGDSGRGGRLNATATTSVLGMDGLGREYRSILSFNTGGLPDAAVVTGVMLKIRKQGGLGADPFTVFPSLTVDMRKPNFGSSASLQAVDYQAAPGQQLAGSFSSESNNGWYTAELDPEALALINVKGKTQLRLQFEAPADPINGADTLNFYSGNAAAANRPVLIVAYYVP